MAKAARDIGASVRARLLNLARERGQVFDLLLTRYALERLLYRLSISDHRNRFVLKGAILVTTWFDDPHRPTRDLDLLGFGESSSNAMLAIWKDICDTALDDGIVFDGSALRSAPIREELEYGGIRLRTTATLAGARIFVTVDIGFGDAVEPGVEEINLPVLLDLPTPRLRAATFSRGSIRELYQWSLWLTPTRRTGNSGLTDNLSTRRFAYGGKASIARMQFRAWRSGCDSSLWP